MALHNAGSLDTSIAALTATRALRYSCGKTISTIYILRISLRECSTSYP